MIKKNISKILFLTGLFLLSFIFFNILIVSTFFIFKISVQSYYSIIALILATLLNLFLLKRNKLLNKEIIGITIMGPIILIVLSILFTGLFYDYSWDSSMYHRVSIGYMMDGYNPVYDDIKEYDLKSENPKYLVESNLYSEYYAKAAYMYGASISKLTGNIEHSKSINILSIITLFLFILAILINKKKKLLYSILFSLVVITPTTIVSQFLTNYNDILVYIYLFMLIYNFYLFDNKIFKDNIESIITYFMILILMINIKFSSFGYAGIFCLGYFIWYIVRKIDKEFFKKFVLTSFLAVIIGLFVVGLSTYPKNFIEHKNPFYPLMGNNKKDIMTSNAPDYFKDKSPIEKFVISTFSHSSNISAGKEKAEYKIPFTFNKKELKNVLIYDVRISGNGILFSGIFIISIIIIIKYFLKIYKDDKSLFYFMFIPIFITLMMIFLMNDVWWARYFPQLHFIIFASLILLDKYLNKKTLLYIFIGIILLNNLMFLAGSFVDAYVFTKRANKSFNEFIENEKCDLVLSTEAQQGAYFVIEERLKDYKIEYSKYLFNDSEYSFMWDRVKVKCK